MKEIGRVSTSKLLLRTDGVWLYYLAVQQKLMSTGQSAAKRLEAMEVVASILPLDSRFAVWNTGKIQSKSDKPIKQARSKCVQSITVERYMYITPMSSALSQESELNAVTGVDINIIEQEMDFEADSLALTKRFLTYWSRQGSSKLRTHEQAELGINGHGKDDGGPRRCNICFYQWILAFKHRPMQSRSSVVSTPSRYCPIEKACKQVGNHHPGRASGITITDSLGIYLATPGHNLMKIFMIVSLQWESLHSILRNQD